MTDAERVEELEATLADEEAETLELRKMAKNRANALEARVRELEAEVRELREKHGGGKCILIDPTQTRPVFTIEDES